MILGLTLWLTNLMKFSSTQNRTFYSLLNPVLGVLRDMKVKMCDDVLRMEATDITTVGT